MCEIASGTIIAGKYRLVEALARGGMGSVWRARHIALETFVAIKFIGAEASHLREARARFEREAKAAAMLHSPHVVQIHDYGVEDEVPYLVMELLEGEDLGDRLKRVGRLSQAETTSIVIQASRALRSAAAAGIVHRDLKPGNLFLARTDGDDEILKVLDFGIAKTPRLRADDDHTRTGTVLGSPRYMSPEQARGIRIVDTRSDLWSLAVIAYRALTGRLPFESPEVADLLVKICTEDAVPPSAIVPELGPAMDAFFARALAHDPDDRYQTAWEMAVAFAEVCGEPPPPSGTFRGMPKPRPRLPSGDAELPPPPPESRPHAPPLPAAGVADTASDSRPKTLRSQVATTPSALPAPALPAPALLPTGDATVPSHPPEMTFPCTPPLPERTLTQSPGTIDIPAVHLPTRPARRMVAGIGLAALLASALVLRTFTRDTAPVSAATLPPVAVESIAPAPPALAPELTTAPPAPAPEATTAPPVPAPEPTTAPPATATAAPRIAAPASATAVHPIRMPAAAPKAPKKRHAILGF